MISDKMTQLDTEDPVLDIFTQLYHTAVARGNPWLAVEMDGEFYHLNDVYDLLKKKSITGLVKGIMEGWSEWIGEYQTNGDQMPAMESLSFEEPPAETSV